MTPLKRLTKQRLDDMEVIIQDLVKARRAIANAFLWRKSLQGHEYWIHVHDNLREIEAAFRKESE